MRVSSDGILPNYGSSFMFKQIARKWLCWEEMDLLTSCTVSKNQLKSLFDLSHLVGYSSYFIVEFCFQFKILCPFT